MKENIPSCYWCDYSTCYKKRHRGRRRCSAFRQEVKSRLHRKLIRQQNKKLIQKELTS